jgi:hypothetical protein
MEQESVALPAARLGYAFGALLTVPALYLVWAAFHDIAHGEADLTVEHTILVLCAAWFLFLAVILVRVKHRLLGLISVMAVGAGLWGQGVVGSAPAGSVSPRSIAIVAAFLWFLLLAARLGFLSWRAGRQQEKRVEA